MKFAFCLFLTSLVLLPGMAVAQEGQFSSEPSPPPLPRSAQNPLGAPKPPPPRPRLGPPKPAPGGNALNGLVGYLDSAMQVGPNDIEAPVTGYGNEALWDVTVPDGLRSDATGSTEGAPNR